MRIKPLFEIDDNQEFWRGTKLRYFYDESNYYDYLLVHVPWEEGMLVVNISENSKRGATYGGVIPVNIENNNFFVTKKDFQFTFGKDLKDWFLIESNDN